MGNVNETIQYLDFPNITGSAYNLFSKENHRAHIAIGMYSKQKVHTYLIKELLEIIVIVTSQQQYYPSGAGLSR